jgi:hypothetical protein
MVAIGNFKYIFYIEHPLSVLFTKSSDFHHREFKLPAATGNYSNLEKVPEKRDTKLVLQLAILY